MSAELYIVTGASRGMGQAIAAQLLATGATLLCLSRTQNAELAAQAADRHATLEQWPVDLAQAPDAAARLDAWLRGLDASRFGSATLINNAALINRVGPMDACELTELSTALRVNLEAPLLLTAAFLRATRDWDGRRRVLNISSGLGRRAMAGSASYCAAKAGIDHLTRALALDEALRPNGAQIVSLAPGVIDTDMQVQLRNAEPAGFPDQANFVRMKQAGQLSSPAEAAARVLAVLNRPDFGSQPVADVRDA